MNINAYFKLGYEWLQKLTAETIKELRKDKADILRASVDNNDKLIQSTEEASKAQIEAIQGLEKAIKDKDITEVVEVSNQSEVYENINNKLDEVIEVFKTEISGIDKEITVKNDLSTLTALFRSGEDKKDLLKALDNISKKIKSPEITDYTLILDDLTTAVENIVIPKVSTEKIEGLLAEVRDACQMDMTMIPETLIENDRIRVILPDKQVERMAQTVIASSGGGLGDTEKNSLNSLAAQYNLLYEISAPYVYVGQSVPGTLGTDAGWRIKRLDTTNGKLYYADAVTTFTKVWTDRATYTY